MMTAAFESTGVGAAAELFTVMLQVLTLLIDP